MAQINSLKRVEIFPSNRANNSNTWSYKDGNPTLVFNFGVQDAYVLSNTLRLQFQYRIRQADTSVPDNLGVGGGPTSVVSQNCFVGAMAAIDTITIANANNQVLEYVRNYPKLVSSLLSAGSSFEDYGTYLTQYFGVKGGNAVAQLLVDMNRRNVSAPLLCGMFLNGEAIPIGVNGTAGLQVRLTLSPSIEANRVGAIGNAGSYYEIINPSLTCALGMPEGGTLPKIDAMSYNSFSTFYGVVANSDETHNINCGLSRVVSVFSNFILTGAVANYLVDSNRMSSTFAQGTPTAFDPCPITRYTTLRGGLKFPYQFSVNETKMAKGVAPTFVGSGTPAQLTRNNASAIKPLSQTMDTLRGYDSNAFSGAGFRGIYPYSEGAGGKGRRCHNSEAFSVGGVGARYDQLGTGAGADFKTRTFSHRFQSKLEDGTPNSVYTFMLHKNMISYNNQGGISVSN